MKFILLLCVLSLASCSTTSWKRPSRPFRLGVQKLSPALDQQKPLAPADFAGWVLKQNKLIGPLSSTCVGALDGKTQRLIWSQCGMSGLTAPVLASGSEDYAVFAYRDGTISRHKLSTGERVWSADVDTFATREMVASGSHLFVVSASQSIYSLDLKTGMMSWVYDGGNAPDYKVQTTTPPVVFGDNLYVGLATGEVLALSFEGRLLWRHNPEKSEGKYKDVVGRMAVDQGRLLVSRYDGVVAALDLENPSTGAKGWKATKPLGSVSTSALQGGVFFVGTAEGYVAAIKASSGEELWRAEIGSTPVSLTVGEQFIYLGCTDGRVVSLKVSNGALGWFDELGSSLFSAPLYAGKDLFFVTGMKNLYGYRIQ